MPSEEMTLEEMTAFVALQIGRRGLQPPAAATVGRWYGRLKEAGRMTREGIKQMLEVHYGEDFGARSKLVLISDLEEKTGVSRYLMLKKAAESKKMIKLGSRSFITERDAEELFGTREDRETGK